MYKRIVKTSRSNHERSSEGRHRFEHWQIDNQVYFITARCRDRFPALASEQAKAIFWDRFEHYAREHQFTPWVVSVLDNHYHALGYLRIGSQLQTMMQRVHGSVAKLVNDTLVERRQDFWRDGRGREYFDGCLRDQKQARLTYRYVFGQAQRHGILPKGQMYPHTCAYIAQEAAIRRALELRAFLENVPYARYEKHSSRRGPL